MKATGVAAIVILAVGGAFWYAQTMQKPPLPAGAPQPVTFAECAVYYPVSGRPPRSCTNGAGVTLTEDLGTTLELQSFIKVATLKPGDNVSSPLFIRGEAAAEWFDTDGTLTATLFDSSGNPLGSGKLEARSLIQPGATVDFQGTIAFMPPWLGSLGILTIQKHRSNTVLRIPVIFK